MTPLTIGLLAIIALLLMILWGSIIAYRATDSLVDDEKARADDLAASLDVVAKLSPEYKATFPSRAIARFDPRPRPRPPRDDVNWAAVRRFAEEAKAIEDRDVRKAEHAAAARAFARVRQEVRKP